MVYHIFMALTLGLGFILTSCDCQTKVGDSATGGKVAEFKFNKDEGSIKDKIEKTIQKHTPEDAQ